MLDLLVNGGNIARVPVGIRVPGARGYSEDGDVRLAGLVVKGNRKARQKRVRKVCGRREDCGRGSWCRGHDLEWEVFSIKAEWVSRIVRRLCKSITHGDSIPLT